MSEWGNLDILEACGAFDPGSNPGSGVIIKFHIPTLNIAYFQDFVYILRVVISEYINVRIIL